MKASLVLIDADHRHAAFGHEEGADELPIVNILDIPGPAWEAMGSPNAVVVTVEAKEVP